MLLFTAYAVGAFKRQENSCCSFPSFLFYDSLVGVAAAAAAAAPSHSRRRAVAIAAVVHVAHRVTGHKYTLVVARTQTRLPRRTTYLGLGTWYNQDILLMKFCPF